MANYNNYSISRAKGSLYLKSAKPQEGYEEVLYGEGEKTYHKYFYDVSGKFKGFSSKEVKTKDGKKLQFLEVVLVDGDNYNKISVPLKNSKGNYTDEVKALVSAFNGADINEKVKVTVKKTHWDNGVKSGENLNVYVNYIDRLNDDGKGLSTGFIPFSDIPKVEKEEDEDLGTTYNWKPVNKFYAQKIKEISNKFENSESPQKDEKTKEDKPKTNKKSPEFPDDEHDDLPF